MHAEAIDIHEVKGLGISNTMTDKGYVVLSRLGNRAFLHRLSLTFL